MHVPASLPACLSADLPGHLSVLVPTCLQCLCLLDCFSASLDASPSACLLAYIAACMNVSLSACFSVSIIPAYLLCLFFLSACLPACLPAAVCQQHCWQVGYACAYRNASATCLKMLVMRFADVHWMLSSCNDCACGFILDFWAQYK